MSVGSILNLLNKLKNNVMRKSSINLVNKQFPIDLRKRYHLA
jgi:hypothetical protein